VTERLRNIFFAPVSIAPLITFRIVFGMLMAFSTLRFMALGWVDDHFVLPVFHFKYFGFEWVEVLPAPVMYALHALLVLASLFVMVGFMYRISAVLVFVLFTYFELIDLTYYLNHYYFVSLISLLLIFVPAHRHLSIDAWLRKGIWTDRVPAWCVHIFKIQLGIVYVYAGLAKINYTWLMEALPLKMWLPAHDKLPIIGDVFTWTITPYLFSWFGMLYDVSIVFFLMWSRTRVYAYIAVIIFHVLVGILFQIGVFPLVMIGGTLIFFSPQWHDRLHAPLMRFFKKENIKTESSFGLKPSKLVLFFLALYISFQLVFPWRFIFYPGNMYWTEEGYRFGWRVMLMEKAGTATFYIKHKTSGKEGMVYNGDFLSDHQEKQMAMQPDMILQYAHFLGNVYGQSNPDSIAVRAEVYVTLNGKPSQLLFDDQLNLLEIKDSFSPKTWLYHYE
jgi:hypothetical protein